MLVLIALVLFLGAIPIALITAVALGPVIVTVLFAIVMAGIVAAVANLGVGMGALGVRGFESWRTRHPHHGHPRPLHG